MSGYTDDLKEFVRKRVIALHPSSEGGRGDATATLARLRRGSGAEPGSNPLLWEETLGLGAQYSGRDDKPTAAERSVYAALTLFAAHQQSVSESMHQGGVSFGTAARQLSRRETSSEQAVLRRFQALATAEALEEALVHARGLVTQFRTARIPLDYGQFAVDLFDLQNPAHRNGVRLRWGRDYYRPEPKTTTAADETTAQITNPQKEQS